MAPSRDTIAAIATAPGRGGIGVVRISGSHARAIAHALTGRVPRARHVALTPFNDANGEAIDHGLVLRFDAPRSFTGEDVIELHAHGSPVVLDLLLARCIELGARRARPGEFSERAYRNGRLDLAQAEAIADLIAAGSEAQARAATRSLQGEFSRRVTALLDALIRLRLYIEAAIDFPEEEIDFLADARLTAELDQLRTQLDQLLTAARSGQRLRDGLHAVIIGAPNAGKSSLLNALAGVDRAIVTPIPGTTRDALRETVSLDGVELTLVDTAGLRDTPDAIEAEGMRRARDELARADLALLLVDTHTGERGLQALQRECPPGLARIILRNKIDLSGKAPAITKLGEHTEIRLSALTGAGLDLLRAKLRQHAGATEHNEGAFSARARHVEALQRVAASLDAASVALRGTRAGELAAEDLRQAQQALSEITGEFTTDDLLGEIFSRFCIGK
jgi:tRNA modification GTPase